MKSLKILIVAAVAVLATALPASAQFRFGPKIGTEVTNMRFDKDVFNAENRAGFTGGLQVEFTIPVINLGFDLSAMYVHRVFNSDALNSDEGDMYKNYKERDYIEIPLHLKYKIGLPVVGSIITPYIFTGPNFAVLASKKGITEGMKNKSFDTAWDFGLGLQLFTHLQIGASYSVGMNKTVELVNKVGAPNINTIDLDSRCNFWTITAAWMF